MAYLKSVEFYLPDKIVSNVELKQEFPDWDQEQFEKKVGVFNRHIASENETALDLAIGAAEKLFLTEKRDNIDFILFCTQSPDYYLPTSACLLQNKLRLSTQCGALDFNLGCSGYIYGLSLAKGLMIGGIATKVLLVTAETYSKHIHPKDKANRTIFGDGASATIICKGSENIGEFVLGTDGAGYDKLIVPNGCFRNSKELEPKIFEYGSGNFSDSNHLYMNGPEIFNFTIEKVPEIVQQLLDKNKTSIEEVDYFIFHQANQYMLNYLRKKIGIPKDKFYSDMKETGNTVSATIPIALKNSIDSGQIKKGNSVMLVGFGVGLSWGGTIIKL